MTAREPDVVVVGAGNAALCAALSAREHVERVCVLERAPREARGGNSHFTAGLVRVPFASVEDVRDLVGELPSDVDLGCYDEAAFLDDLARLSRGRCDPELAQVLVREARPTLLWLRDRGARFQLSTSRGRQAFERDGRLRFWGGAAIEFEGGGVSHMARLFELARAAGIEVRYDARARQLIRDARGAVCGVVASVNGERRELAARSVVLASGGFEANREQRAEKLGPRWSEAIVRGTRFNTGDGIEMALEAGAASFGHREGCHAVAWDASAPPFGDLDVTNVFNKHSYPFGITVNRNGRRFIDEGADFRNYTYARYGAAILEQPGGIAYQIFDARVLPLLRDEYHRPPAHKCEAESLVGLARELGLAPDALSETVDEFNAALDDTPFDPTRLDGKGTRGLEPPKSNWAQPIDSPPFLGTAVRCGITFTFGGLRVDTRARVVTNDGPPLPGLYAAGELVGGLFYHNYPGGAGLTAGAVFGRIAGREAALSARGRAPARA